MKNKYRNICAAGFTGLGCLIFSLFVSGQVFAAALDETPQFFSLEEENVQDESSENFENISSLEQTAVFKDAGHVTVTIQNIPSIENSVEQLFNDESDTISQTNSDKIILTESLSDYFIFNIEEITDGWFVDENSSLLTIELNSYIQNGSASLELPVSLKEDYQTQSGNYPLFSENRSCISVGNKDEKNLISGQIFLEYTAPVTESQEEEQNFSEKEEFLASAESSGEIPEPEDNQISDEAAEMSENDSGEEEAEEGSFEEYIQNEVIGNQGTKEDMAEAEVSPAASPTVSPTASPEPLPAFTVEKTADRLKASPGDTITYHICIQNTGNVTLHSVLSIERFLIEGITAHFLEEEGVTLLDEGKRALIEEILPGESASLEAEVTLPDNFTGSDLINQVAVTTQETGETEITASASTLYTASVTEQTTETSSETQAVSYEQPASNPKTGDDHPLWILLAIVIVSFLLIVCAGNLLFLGKERRM